MVPKRGLLAALVLSTLFVAVPSRATGPYVCLSGGGPFCEGDPASPDTLSVYVTASDALPTCCYFFRTVGTGLFAGATVGRTGVVGSGDGSTWGKETFFVNGPGEKAAIIFDLNDGPMGLPIAGLRILGTCVTNVALITNSCGH